MEALAAGRNGGAHIAAAGVVQGADEEVRPGVGADQGGGVEGAGLRYANTTNTNSLPYYARWDAMVAYEQPSYTVRTNLYNVFDQSYYEGVYQGHSVPGTLRMTQFTLEYKFF